MKRLGEAIDQLRLVENVDHLIGRRGIGHARSGTNRREVISGYVGDSEAMGSCGSDCQGEASAAPAREAAAHGVDGGDVEARGEKDVEDLRELRLRHAAQWG